MIPILGNETSVDRLYVKLRETLGDVVPDFELKVKAELAAEINQLKIQKNAVILGHNYMEPALFHSIPDFTGDSLELCRKAAKTDKDVIVFCGVRFMAESAKILNPSKTVLLPSLEAGCSLAASITAQDVRDLRRRFPGVPVVTYVNTYADVKALSDSCCTSSNAARIAEKLGAPDILFVPDQNLAYQVALKTKRMYLPPPEPHKFHPREYAEMVEPLIREGERQGLVGNVFAWEGACHVHHQMTVDDIARIRRDDPEATVIVHGEVRPDLQRAADAVLSTSQMAKYVEAHPERSRYAILTECGLVVRMELEHPEKQFYKPCRLCQYMKATDLESVYRTLRDEPADQRITVPPDVREGAARAMLRMIELAA
jgi:quinolinate synthase